MQKPKVKIISASPLYRMLPILIVLAGLGFAQVPSRDLLNRLAGSWTMTGTVQKKHVQYYAEARWVLQNGFISLHMKDTASPPEYEANLFIGLDPSKNQCVAHWLDSFGGAGSRVVGLGPVTSDKVEIVYPYEEGRFRNVFRYNSAKDEWSLVIESEGKDGQWSGFAQYIMKRR